MADMAPITDFSAEVLPQLMGQYTDSTHLNGILQLLFTEMNMLDAAQMEIQFILDLNTAVGAQLDILGEIVSLPRVGRSDSVYREAIRLRFVTQNSGTPEDIVALVKEVTGSTTVQYVPAYPAGYWVVYDGAESLSQAELDRISPAGVQGYLGCLLIDDVRDNLIVDATGDYILVVGPCESTSVLTLEDGDALLTEDDEQFLLEM